MGLGIRGWRRVGLGLCKVGGVGPRSNSAPWILCSAVRTISFRTAACGKCSEGMDHDSGSDCCGGDGQIHCTTARHQRVQPTVPE